LNAEAGPLEIAFIALEGAVDSFCGRPRGKNPHSAKNLLELRGQAEAARWLREAA
jgi:hypothetical protein